MVMMLDLFKQMPQPHTYSSPCQACLGNVGSTAGREFQLLLPHLRECNFITVWICCVVRAVVTAGVIWLLNLNRLS